MLRIPCRDFRLEHNRRVALLLVCLGTVLAVAGPCAARAQDGRGCNAPTAEPIVHIPLPGNPFTPVVTADGCRVFVALAGAGADVSGGVAVVRRNGGKLTL